MYAVAVVPALIVAVARLWITESPHWLLARGRRADAEAQMARLLRRSPRYPAVVHLCEPKEKDPSKGNIAKLFTARYRRAAILASVPWFLQDLGTYGIGIFTPTILARAVGHKVEHDRNIADLVNNDALAARGSALIDAFLIVGIVAAVLLVNRFGSIRLQVLGFVGCAAGLAMAAGSSWATGGAQVAMIFAGFMIFNFMTNMGPNAQTYLLAGEVFPTKVRGTGAGFAAAFAKIGAVATAFLFPILLADIGREALLSILITTSILGAVVTWAFRIETTGVNLETIGVE